MFCWTSLLISRVLNHLTIGLIWKYDSSVFLSTDNRVIWDQWSKSGENGYVVGYRFKVTPANQPDQDWAVQRRRESHTKEVIPVWGIRQVALQIQRANSAVSPFRQMGKNYMVALFANNKVQRLTEFFFSFQSNQCEYQVWSLVHSFLSTVFSRTS